MKADLGSTIAAINRGRLHRSIAKPWHDDEPGLTLRQVAERQFKTEKQALERLTPNGAVLMSGHLADATGPPVNAA